MLTIGLTALLWLGADASAGNRIVHPKRGIASSRYLASNPSKLVELGATWAYNWSATRPAHLGSLTWVPMLWGSGSVTPGTIASLRAEARAGQVHYLLGFNEPDMSSQSNLTPQQAAALWPQLDQTGLVLGSPAPAVPSDGWLSNFMALARARHLRVDFIALHYYQDFTSPTAVSDLRQQLTAIHNAYHLPIWITEIGAMDVRTWGEPMAHPPTASQAAAYIRKLFAMLDALPFVQRYAWFTDDCWSDSSCRYGSLFNASGRATLAGAAFENAP